MGSGENIASALGNGAELSAPTNFSRPCRKIIRRAYSHIMANHFVSVRAGTRQTTVALLRSDSSRARLTKSAHASPYGGFNQTRSRGPRLEEAAVALVEKPRALRVGRARSCIELKVKDSIEAFEKLLRCFPIRLLARHHAGIEGHLISSAPTRWDTRADLGHVGSAFAERADLS